LYTLPDNVEETSPGAAADSRAAEDFAFVTFVLPVTCWFLDSGGGGTMALNTLSTPFQPFFVWMVTMNTF
jgi:hypothetical protein